MNRLLLFIFTLGVFLFSLQVRSPWFGTYSKGRHQDTSVSLMLFSKNWYRDGPINDRFALVWNPKTVEMPTLISRQPYPSFPFGAVVPIYLLAKITAEEPSDALIMSYNLATHFLVSLILGFTILLLLERLGYSRAQALLFALPVPLLELLLPGPLYWHQNVYYFGAAVLLPLTLAILLEFSKSRAARKLQVFCFFCGALTDWLMLVFLLVLYLKRLFLREDASFWKFWRWPLLAYGIYLIQLLSLGNFGGLLSKFWLRTGLQGSEHSMIKNFWGGNVVLSYGVAGSILLISSALFLLLALLWLRVRKIKSLANDANSRLVLTLSALILVPIFFKIHLLSNHSINHQFTALPLALVLASVPFVLVPVFLIELLSKRNLIPLAVAASYLLVGLYLGQQFPRYKELFPVNDPTEKALGSFVGEHTEFEDIVFSTEFQVTRHWRERIPLGYSMKPVYRIRSLSDLKEKVSAIDANYTVNLLSRRRAAWSEEFVPLLQESRLVKRNAEYELFKIPKHVFLKVAEQKAAEEQASLSNSQTPE